ncbi:MAG TPA: HD domain-containing phosphohydrolase [Terriglobales bacterium]|nr:HD domain-containing phosphohydrolase [Terriglobales bacterium]
MPETILIADDHESSLSALEELLSLEGFEVVTAPDGEAALAEFRRGQPDLLLLDVKMPRMTGFEVCRHIKGDADTRLVPVILITALTATEDRLAGIEAGADDFLTKPVDREQLLARVRSLLRQKAYTDELERAESVLFALARSIEGKDPYTEGHCERLAELSARLGQFIVLEAVQITALRRAGIVHDIGKVAVPDHILLKPGKLTAKERKHVQRHPLVGEGICAPLKSFQQVLPIIRHHHEKMDGTGYPDGLKGKEIPITARVLQIVDVYDALTTARPYKKALPPAEALSVMEREVKRGWWDPDVFAAFAEMMGREVAQPLLLAHAAAAAAAGD